MNKVCVRGQRIYFYRPPEPIPKLQVNFSRIEFDMDETWSSFLSVVAQFIQNGEPKNVKVEDGYCFVPSELEIGAFELCLRGDDGESVVATVNRLTLEVCEGFDPSGETSLPPSPDLYTQLIKEIDSGKKIAQSVREDADSGKFNGPQGPQGPKGDTGDDGITPHIGDNGNWYLGDKDTGKPSRGEMGPQGPQGEKGETGATGPAGPVGADGAPGKDGTSATHSWNGTVLTITSANGTSSADLKGEKGDKGDKGDTGAPGPTYTAGENITISADNVISATGGGGGGGSVPKPLTYDYMPEGYPKKTIGTVSVMEEQELAFADEEGTYVAYPNKAPEIVEGQTYIVTWDGADYECVCSVYFSTILAFGNKSIYGAGDDTGEPFLYLSTGAFATLETTASHTISVKKTGEIVTPMAEEFLPVASEDNYGAVKKSEIVTAYNFNAQAPHDQMVEAIAAFENGNASIAWVREKVINAHYNSSDDTITVVFAHEPLKISTYENNGGFYVKTLGSATYGELQGRQIRITNDNNVYTVLSVEGESPNVTLRTDADRITINGIYGMSTTEMILKSSTEGSSKNFKITVDDSGTISATEVTST